MQSVNLLQSPCEIVSSGVDWITATANASDTKQMQDALSMSEFERARDRGEKIVPVTRLGYVGYAADNYFHGHNENGRIIIATGTRASELFRSVVQVSDNVSRLDVQVTADFGNDKLHVAKQSYDALASRTPADVRVRNCTLLLNQPEGETLNVGKRKSDFYGRIYDKGAEACCAPALTLWRWELEVKRRAANRIAAYLRDSHSDKIASREVVFSYFNRRGLLPPWKPSQASGTPEWTAPDNGHNTLLWFRDTLSKTIRKQIELHGRAKVMDALGLEVEIQLNLERSPKDAG